MRQHRKKLKAKRVTKGGVQFDSLTELRYLRERLTGGTFFGEAFVVTPHPEPLIITKSGRAYTPDFKVETVETHKVLYIEVKGAYKLPSHERARLAFEIAAERNPGCYFLWAQARRKGRARAGWAEELWFGGGFGLPRTAERCTPALSPLRGSLRSWDTAMTRGTGTRTSRATVWLPAAIAPRIAPALRQGGYEDGDKAKLQAPAEGKDEEDSK